MRRSLPRSNAGPCRRAFAEVLRGLGQGHREKTIPRRSGGYIASAVPLVALKATQTGGRTPTGAPHTAALTEEETFVCKQLGLSETDFMAAKVREGK